MTYYNITYEDLDSLMEVVDKQCYGCYGEENPYFCNMCYIKDIKHGVAEWCKFIKNNNKNPDFTNHTGNALDYPN